MRLQQRHAKRMTMRAVSDEQHLKPTAIEDQLHAWRDSENAAAELEAQVRQYGQAASDPRLAELHMKARELRKRSDEMLREIVDSLRSATDAVLNRRA
jgi:hypothetical protein